MTISKEVIQGVHIGERIDKVLSFFDPSISRSKAQEWIKQGVVLVNEERVKPNYRCKHGDELSWYIPEEPERIIEAEPIPLDIVYEDDALIVINKDAGVLTHPTEGQLTGTLVNALLHHTSDLAQIDTERPGIVHRLDKDTSGLIVVAKTDEVFSGLSSAFKEREVVRKYEALVHGEMEHPRGVIEAPIGRHPKRRLQMAVQDTGRYAKTHFNVIALTDGYTHVSCQLDTGRTHQIRVHMEYINHPIVHDPVYGSVHRKNAGGQMLFAKTIAFQHPLTKKQMEFTIDAPAFFEREKRLLGFS